METCCVQDSSQLINSNERLGLPDLGDKHETEEYEEMEWETSLSTEVDEIQKMWEDTAQRGEHLQINPLRIDEGTKSQLIIVPDTNIWIENTELLKRLLDTEFSNGNLPTLVIPWMVLQELDIKKSKNTYSTDVHKGSRSATRFMHQLLSSQHPRVTGQRASEAALSEENFEPENADDQILLCALQCADRNPNSLVVFVTNDRNLLNKALIETVSVQGKHEKLLVCDSTSVLTKIKERISSSEEPNKRHIRIPKRAAFRKNVNTNNEKIVQKVLPPTSKPVKRPRDYCAKETSKVDDETHVVPVKKQSRDWTIIPKCDTFQNILDLLQSTFSHIIESKMKEDFGDTWLYALKIKPPWTFQSSIKCIIVHWIAVFSFVFGQKAKIHAESLLELIKEYDMISSFHDISKTNLKQIEEDIIEITISLFTSGKSTECSGLKDGEVKVCRQALLDYLKKNKV